MDDGNEIVRLRNIIIAGIVAIILTVILAVVVVIVAVGQGRAPAVTPTPVVVTATPTDTPPVPPAATDTPPPPTATDTPQPTGTFTPAPPPATSPVTAPLCRNTARGALNVRKGPGVEYAPPIGTLAPGQEVPVIGKNAPQPTWWNIRSGSLEGWVSARYCAANFDPDRVPVVDVPPVRPTPCLAQVPDLTYRPIEQAEQRARAASLLPVRDSRCLPASAAPDLGGIVIGQSLPAGQSVVCGAQIVLTHYSYELCAVTPTPCLSSCAEFGGELYTVRPGDWIAQLCRSRGYGGQMLRFCIGWVTLHSCLSNPDHLEPGQQICLPAR